MTTKTVDSEANGASLSLLDNMPESAIYEYDINNRLKKVTTADTIAAYSYLPDGRRASKTVNGVKTSHIWDGNNIVADTKNGTLTKYIRSNKLEQAVTGDNIQNYTVDSRGDVIDFGDTDYFYDAFGNVQTETNPNPFGYCGEYFDQETGFIYLRNRYYDPTIGRFTQEDPIRDGSNWYAYCANNPTSFVDPLGLIPTTMEAAEMARQIYNFDEKSKLSEKDISERTVKLSDGRTWEMHDLWIRGTVIMGVYQLVDENGGYSELAAVFQGTTNIEDWVDNIDAYSNTFSRNLIHARLFGKGFADYHPDVELTFVGHSKGGGEAIAAALHAGKNAITFNAANFDFGKPIVTWWQSRKININNYYVNGEILSTLIGQSSVGTNHLIEGTGSSVYKHRMEAVISGLQGGMR